MATAVKTAFITGCTGQDGYYLSEWLHWKHYRVYGLVRRCAQERSIPSNVIAVSGDVTDPALIKQIGAIKPDEIYHLAATTHVGESFTQPRSTLEINALGTLNALEGARAAGAKFYNAATSELFGNSPPPQNESTPFAPCSPYGIAKLAAYWLTVHYRASYRLFACNGILFNHESPRRGLGFVTRKVARYCAQLATSPIKMPPLRIGNLEARRDWGHARDYVRGMWLMLQEETPDDFVLATGVDHSVHDLLDEAFAYIGIDNWQSDVVRDTGLFRPADVDRLVGDASKAKRRLGWTPTTSFENLIGEMIDSELGTPRQSADETTSACRADVGG